MKKTILLQIENYLHLLLITFIVISNISILFSQVAGSKDSVESINYQRKNRKLSFINKSMIVDSGVKVSLSPNKEKVVLAQYSIKDMATTVSIYNNKGELLNKLVIDPFCKISLANDGRFAVIGCYPLLSLPVHYKVYTIEGNVLLDVIEEKKMGRHAIFSDDGEIFVFMSIRQNNGIEFSDNIEVYIYNREFKKIGDFYMEEEKIFPNEIPIISSDNNIRWFHNKKSSDSFIKMTTEIDKYGYLIERREGWE